MNNQLANAQELSQQNASLVNVSSENEELANLKLKWTELEQERDYWRMQSANQNRTTTVPNESANQNRTTTVPASRLSAFNRSNHASSNESNRVGYNNQVITFY